MSVSFGFYGPPLLTFKTERENIRGLDLVIMTSFNQIDCKAGTTAEGQNLLANISTGRASLLQGQYRRLALLVEILANKFCPSAVVPALQSIWFYNT